MTAGGSHALAQPAGARTARLRPDVALVEDGGELRLVDGSFSVQIPLEAKTLVTQLGSSVAAIAARLTETLGDDAPDADDVQAFVDELWGLGFLEGSPDPTAHRRAARRDEREQERDAALHDALVFAQTSVPLYRERFAAAQVGAEFAAADALARLPVLTRAELRAAFPARALADGTVLDELVASGRYAIGSTSGTTDERVQVLSDALAGQIRADATTFFGVDGPALGRGAILTTPICAGHVCHLGASTIEERTVGVTTTLTSTQDLFGLSDAETRAIASELSTVQPDVFIVHPWYALWFALRAAELKLEVFRPRVVLSTFQPLTRTHQRLLREHLGPTFSYYSATELGGYLIGTECALGSLHVREDDVFVEVSPLPDRPDVGTFVVTSLRNRVMPLVRYAPGDVGRFAAPCSCAFGDEWRTFEVLGRAKDAIRTPAGRPIFPAEIDAVVGDHGPTFYRVVQTGPARATLEVLDRGHADTAAIAQRLAALLDMEVDVQHVRRFPPERSLKFRTVVALPPAAGRGP